MKTVKNQFDSLNRCLITREFLQPPQRIRKIIGKHNLETNQWVHYCTWVSDYNLHEMIYIKSSYFDVSVLWGDSQRSFQLDALTLTIKPCVPECLV